MNKRVIEKRTKSEKISAKEVVARLKAGATGTDKKLQIKPPKFQVADIKIRGLAPLVMHAFSQKSRDAMIAKQEAGQQARKGQLREPKDFQAVYEGAMHISRQGWHGIPAAAFRNACISACRTIGFKMTLAKLSIFVKANGFDRKDGSPLVKITKGQPRQHFATARNDDGSTDVRCRPMWDEGWEAIVQMQWDADQFSASDVMNLMARAGLQVGICEGRPDSRKSAGLGWGIFEVVN